MSNYSHAEQLSELLRGLECTPVVGTFSPTAMYALGQTIATQAKQGAGAGFIEEANSLLCEQLAMAIQHMTPEQKDAFDAEWSAHMADELKKASIPVAGTQRQQTSNG